MSNAGYPDQTWTVLRILRWTTEFLSSKGVESARLDAEILLSDLLGFSRVDLYCNFDRPLDPGELAGYRERVKRRASREPAAYIIGTKEFYSLEFKVTPAVLIPRPETEHMVDEAVSLAKTRWPDEELLLADIGAGSGAVAAALASELPAARVLAVDISDEALEVARENIDRLELADRVSLSHGDLLEPVDPDSNRHMITANLPYIPRHGFDDMMPEVRKYEPHLALDGGEDGLDLIRRIIADAPERLRPDGLLLLEIWPTQGDEIKRLAVDAGFKSARILTDLSGKARIAVLDMSDQIVSE